MEGLVKYNDGEKLVDVFGAFRHCGLSKKDARKAYDECDLEVDEDGYADADDLVEELRDRFPDGGDDLIDFLIDSPEEPQIDEAELRLSLTILKSLSQVHQTVRHYDRSLGDRLALLMANQMRKVEQFCNSSQEDTDPAVYLTDRIGFPVSKDQLFEIGNRASRYYHQVYHRYPPKMPRWIDGRSVLVNKYTEATAPETLDRAIYDVIGGEDDN